MLQDTSGARFSRHGRFPGSLSIAERLLDPYAMWTGAQVMSGIRPRVMSRLYELGRGHVSAVSAFACFNTPAVNARPSFENFKPWGPFASTNRLSPWESEMLMLKWAPLPKSSA